MALRRTGRSSLSEAGAGLPPQPRARGHDRRTPPGCAFKPTLGLDTDPQRRPRAPLLVHLSCLAVLWTGVTWKAAVLGLALYLARMFGIGAGYHRYFSHRAFSTGRVFQFMLAFLAQTSAQSSVLWWAARHRDHHLHSETEQDTHSALRHGF